VFDGIDDQRITQANHQSDHDDADAAARAGLPKHDRTEHDQ